MLAETLNTEPGSYSEMAYSPARVMLELVTTLRNVLHQRMGKGEARMFQGELVMR